MDDQFTLLFRVGPDRDLIQQVPTTDDRDYREYRAFFLTDQQIMVYVVDDARVSAIVQFPGTPNPGDVLEVIVKRSYN